ncbi:MAG: aliphatic sulfonate ABC transporter substrate-binding protein [Clostridia bacterium]|nr:aliphatic sulfonate ABC transporter substrate-binding protein [Clostridia bacterium]
MNYHLRKIFKHLGAMTLAAAMAVSLTACGNSGNTAGSSSEAGDSVPDEIRIGYWATPNAELLVKETGALEALYPDITVTWVEFTSGADILTAMQAGSIDFSTIGTPPGTTGIANEYPFKVYYLEDIIGEMEGLIVREDSGINSLEDVKGKTIATSFSTTSHFSLLNALDNAGIDAADVTIMDMDASNIYAAWDRGDIDGAYIWESVKSQILNDGGKEIISSAEVAEQGAPTCEFAIVHNDFYEKYPDVVKAYAGLLDQAAQQYNDEPEEAAKLMSQGLGLTEEETLQAMGGIIELTEAEQAEYLGEDGKLVDIIQKTADFLYQQGNLASEVDSETIRNAILSGIHE